MESQEPDLIDEPLDESFNMHAAAINGLATYNTIVADGIMTPASLPEANDNTEQGHPESEPEYIPASPAASPAAAPAKPSNKSGKATKETNKGRSGRPGRPRRQDDSKSQHRVRKTRRNGEPKTGPDARRKRTSPPKRSSLRIAARRDAMEGGRSRQADVYKARLAARKEAKKVKGDATDVEMED